MRALPVADEQLHELELHVVRVLELVDEHEPVAVLQLAPQVGPLAQQAQGEPDLGADIHSSIGGKVRKITGEWIEIG